MERIMTHLGRKESDGNSIWIRYRFLIRLIALGLMLLFILSVSTTILISRRSYHQLEVSTEETVQSIAKSIDDNLRENLKVLRQISQFCIENPSTYEKTIKNYMASSEIKRYDEIAAGVMLKGFSLSMPLLSGLSIYYHNSGDFLYAEYADSYLPKSTIGMNVASVYCSIAFPGIDSVAFIRHLDNLTEPGFYLNEKLLDTEQIVYLYPVAINIESVNRRVLVSKISSSSLNRVYASQLGDMYDINMIEWQGQCIYRHHSEEKTHLFRYENPDGFSVQLSMPENVYRNLFTEYSNAILHLGIISVILCAAFIAFFIFFMYKPLNQIVQSTGVERKTDEISTIMGFISRKTQIESELREELENEKHIMRQHRLEMLLLGVSVEENNPVLKDNFRYHFVAVSPLMGFSDINHCIQQLQTLDNILAYEQLRSNQLVMIVGTDQKEGVTDSFRKQFADMFGYSTALGIGSISESEEMIHRSFLDALLDLKEEPTEETGQDTSGMELIEQEEYELFKTQLVSNDPSCVQTAEKMFRKLDKISASFLFYWHSYCQLIERIGGMVQQYGYSINLADYLKGMSDKEIQGAYSDFLSKLELLISSGPQSETALEKKYGDSIVEYINENVSNIFFSISDITEKYNLSDYTASKIIRDKTKMNFKRYLTHVRLETAKNLLNRTEKSIQDIAVECGFSSSSYFIRVFKTEIGLTPLQYRNSLRA